MNKTRLYLGAIVFLLFAVAVTFAACGSDNDGNSPAAMPTSQTGATITSSPPPVLTAQILTPPSPMKVEVSLDSRSATTVEIKALGGGTVETSAADGTRYTLEIPGNALIADTEITMTPVTEVDGAPVEGGKVVGVQLQPEGLRFYKEATLTIHPSEVSGTGEAVSFSYLGQGEEFHLFPPVNDPETLSFNIMHFSGYAGFVDIGEGTQLVADPNRFVPTDWESQIEHWIGELITEERNAHLRGEEGNPQFIEILEALFRDYNNQVISPLLPGIRSDCGQAKQNSSKVLNWSRNVELFGMAETFRQQTDSIMDAVVAGADNCWEEVTQPCLDTGDPEQMAEAFEMARMNLLLGGSEERYNPQNPDLECSGCVDVSEIDLWAGTLQLEFSDSETGHNRTASVSRSLDTDFELKQVGEPLRGADGKVRSISFGATSIRATGAVEGVLQYKGDSDPVTVKGSGEPYLIFGGLRILPLDCEYELSFNWSFNAVHQPSGNPSFGVGGSLKLREALPFNNSGRLNLTGSRPVYSYYSPGSLEIPREFFTPMGSYENNIYEFRGTRDLSNANVTWTLTSDPEESPEEEPTPPPIGVS